VNVKFDLLNVSIFADESIAGSSLVTLCCCSFGL